MLMAIVAVTCLQMEENVQSIACNPHVRAVILKSEVPKAFSVGADLKERATMKVSSKILWHYAYAHVYDVHSPHKLTFCGAS